jgi:hypothetical protein
LQGAVLGMEVPHLALALMCVGPLIPRIALFWVLTPLPYYTKYIVTNFFSQIQFFLFRKWPKHEPTNLVAMVTKDNTKKLKSSLLDKKMKTFHSVPIYLPYVPKETKQNKNYK